MPRSAAGSSPHPAAMQPANLARQRTQPCTTLHNLAQPCTTCYCSDRVHLHSPCAYRRATGVEAKRQQLVTAQPRKKGCCRKSTQSTSSLAWFSLSSVDMMARGSHFPPLPSATTCQCVPGVGEHEEERDKHHVAAAGCRKPWGQKHAMLHNKKTGNPALEPRTLPGQFSEEWSFWGISYFGLPERNDQKRSKTDSSPALPQASRSQCLLVVQAPDLLLDLQRLKGVLLRLLGVLGCFGPFLVSGLGVTHPFPTGTPPPHAPSRRLRRWPRSGPPRPGRGCRREPHARRHRLLSWGCP